jgi:UDP-N-acetylglucosamine 2-epimerase
VAMEAMILNKPVISLQIEKWAEEDEFVKTGALLSISNVNDVKDGISRLLYDKEFKDKLLDNSQKFVENYFAHKGTASKTLAKGLDTF